MSRTTPMPAWWLDFVQDDEREAVAEQANRSPARRPSWLYIARRTVRESSRDECTTLAAALTYYSVLSLCAAVVAALSLLGLMGQGQRTVVAVTGTLNTLGASAAAGFLRPTLLDLTGATGAGPAFVLGSGAALWAASGYVGSFGRAVNRIYQVDEGRPIWKLRPLMLLLTVLTVVLAALVAVGLAVTGPVATSVGRALGVSDTTVFVWDVAKWPVLMWAVVAIVGLLYHATPNVKHPRFRWMSGGAAVAIVVWLLASAGLAVYVVGTSHRDGGTSYPALGGVVAFLLWLWVTNLALLFGAELDAEFERSRELQAGVPAEVTLQLPARDTRKIMKAARKLGQDVEEGRRLRVGY